MPRAVLACAVLLAAAGMACAAPTEGRTALAAAGDQQDQKPALIDHIMPEPDSSGPAPKRFEWTPAANADAYTIAVWSEVDMQMWRMDHVRTTWVTPPPDPVLAPGTYFWSVTAWQGDRVLTESGRAAFVVRQ